MILGSKMNVVSILGGALAKSGTTLKKIGNAEKDFMQKTMSHYLHPMKRFLENDIKTITVSRILYFIRTT